MNRKITIIAAVSSIFIGFNASLITYNSIDSEVSPVWLAVFMGIAAGLGSMMIELVVPQALIYIWEKVNWFYRVVAVIATAAVPTLFIYALPSDDLAKLSKVYITGALVAYMMYYSYDKITTQVQEDSSAAEDEKQYQRKKEMMELEHKLQLENDLALQREENKKAVKLAKIGNAQTGGDASPESIYKYWQDNPGISNNQLGFAFGIDPKTAKRRLEIAKNGK